MILFENGALHKITAKEEQTATPFIAFCSVDETTLIAQLLGVNPHLLEVQRNSASTRYESLNGLDYLSIIIPESAGPGTEKRVEIYFAKQKLFFISGEVPALEKLLQNLPQRKSVPSPEETLHLFFAYLTEHDSSALEDIEERISLLEDEVLNAAQHNYTAIISSLRRRLLALKRYYESLFDLLEDLEENVNGLFSKSQLHFFRLLTNRANRLSNTVLSLRDYVTQVREAYQNQIDISLNKTMKLFTVITAIFSPLTLIVGWYGMNLIMPEFSLPYAYPVVIGFCVAVVVGSIVYFKKNKWF